MACSDDILDKQPPGELSSGSFWKTEEDASAGLTAIYNALNTGRQGWGLNHMGLMDLFTPIGNARDNDKLAISSGTHDASNQAIERIWRTSYKGLVRANDFIENIDNIDMDKSLATRMKAEAYFLRALYYHNIIDNFGDAPLFEHVPTVEDALVTRTPRADIIALIKTDLDFAINNLESSYSGFDVGRATIGAATTLKLKVALLENDWSTAATVAEQIMRMGYELLPNYADVFTPENENSSEVIFDIQNGGDPAEKFYSTRSGTVGGWTWVQPTLFLVNKFEVIDPNPVYVQEDKRIPTEVYDHFEGRDPRMDYTIVRPGAHLIDRNGKDRIHPYGVAQYQNSQTGLQARKYTIPGKSSVRPRNAPLNWIIFRYSDILLNYLEAVAKRDGIGSVSQTILDQTINKVRTRASDRLPLYTQGNITWDNIYDEYIRELAFEGWVYSSMKRWRTLEINNGDRVLGLAINSTSVAFSINPLYISIFDPNKNYLFPIPQGERDINPNLTQNPGYSE